MRVGVIGAGIAGLAVAHALRRTTAQDGAPCAVTVWDRSDRVGGRIGTTHDAGYTIEWAANALLPSATDARALVSELGLDDAVIPADARAANRFIYLHGALHAFPTGPLSLATCGALSPAARLRVALEPLFATRVTSEETIHAYAARHLGEEASRILLGAAVRGIFAGDSTRLSLDAAFPLMRTLERDHRSLIVAQARLARTRARGTMWSLRHGLGALTDALGDALGGAVRLGAEATALARDAHGVRVSFADGRTEVVDALVLAAPSDTAAALLEPHDASAAHTLRAIERASVAVVALGVAQRALARPIDGYGFLTAPGERLPVLGVLVDSVVFPDRAPRDRTLVRVMIGGSPDPAHATLSDAALIERATTVVRDVLGLQGEPDRVWLYRHAEAIPQYTLGHAARIAEVRTRVAAVLPRVHVVGNACDGVSVGSIIEAASRTAESILRS